MTKACCSLLILLLAACGQQIEPGTTPGQPAVVKGLGFALVAESALPGTDSFVGTVESSSRGLLSARIDGQVTKVMVREGDSVSAGQLLLVLGNNVAGNQLRQAEAGLAQAQQGEATAQAQLTLAEKTYDRYRQLFTKEAITPQEMDQMTANLDVARKGLQAAKAAVAQAGSGRDSAQIAAGYSQVRAPFAGRVVSKQIDLGSTVMPGQPLLTLDRQGVWQVRAEIPESFAGRILPNTVLSIEIPALGKTVDGTVAEVQPAADPRSRSFQIKINLPPIDGIVAGFYARVVLNETGSRAILIPAGALVTRGQLQGVFVRDGQTLHLRLIKVGRQVGDQLEVLSGLTVGEKIVSAGAERARNGARVED